MNASPCSFSAYTTGDNGNVFQIVNNRSSIRSESFNYDALNRIANAQQTAGTQWGESYTIDAWGNMTAIGSYNGKPHESLSTTALTNNQLSGYGYDAAGNMTSNGTTSYVYDAENRLVWTNGSPASRYIYDANGQRVEKCAAASATTACPTSGTTGTLYWRGTGSDTLDESDLGGNPQEEYIFFNGQRIARRDVSSTGATVGLHYYFSDHLGSHGVVETVTTTTGATSCDQDIDYYPYGGVENDYCSSTSVPQNYKFTGKERDTESGLDNFGARYNASNLGRFMSPDPIFMHVLRVLDPQRLNLYAYARNNPLVFLDPTGKDIVSGTGDQKAIKSALVEIARHPGGREMLTKLDKLTQKITLNTGTGIKYPDGTPAPAHHLPDAGSDPHINRVTDSSGKITDVTSPNIQVTIDPALSQQMRDTGDPNAPKSDAELLGHELKETEHTDFKLPGTEESTNAEVDAVLDSSKDMSKKDAEKFVDDLLKPNTNNQQQPPPPPPCTAQKDKPCPQ